MKKFLRITLSISVLCLSINYLLTFIKPESLPFINISSVVIPYLAIFAVLVSLLHIFDNIYWRLFALITGLSTLLIISDYYEIFADNSEATETDINLLSYNVSFFSVPTVFKAPYYKAELNQRVFKIRDKITELNPDIITLQEFFNDEKSEFYNNIKRYQENGYQYYLKSSPRHHNGTDRGIVTFSKYPIVNAGIVCNSTNTYNGAIFTDIKVSDEDTIKVINVHLTSMAFYGGKRTPFQLLKFFYHSYSEASKERANQIESIDQAIAASNYPVIVVGDFNETPNSFIYRKMKSKLNNSFETNGSGFGYTFYTKLKPLAFRIDHLFYGDDFECQSFNTLSGWNLSEHKPIQTSLNLK